MNTTAAPAPAILQNAPAFRCSLSPLASTVLAAVLVAVVGWFDYATGEFSMALLYLAPVALAAWCASRASGWGIALLSGAAWLLSDLTMSRAYGHPLIPYWNAAMLTAIYGVIVQLLVALRHSQRDLERRIAERTAELATANVELLAAQMRLIEAEKLESIGRLAAGVAHEVKNPLMTITMAADYLAQVIPAGEPDGAAMIADLREAVARANRVVSEMLEFARPGAMQFQPESFRSIAERALGLVRLELLRKQISVVELWGETEPPLPLDANKIEQVLVNLFLNAIQAMPAGGTLTLNAHADAAGFSAHIEDTGPGIATENRKKLFDPFFTTKPLGQGTGLGLTVARQIVRMHGGTLVLGNRAGGGACATIHFPNTNQKPQTRT